MSKWSKSNASREQATVRAVIAYAADLRGQAARHAAAHPGEGGLYSPSENAARVLCSRVGPEKALETLRVRARTRELLVEEQRVVAARARRELRVHQTAAVAARAQSERRTLGQRLDDVLRGLELVSDAPVARIDAEPVKSGKPDSGGVPLRRQRERDALAADAERIVVRLERELNWSRRRLVETEDAA